VSTTTARDAAAGLERTLRDLPQVGERVKDRGYRQVWRFEHAGKRYFLKFYRRGRALSRDWGRRLFRGSPAQREFTRLQWLQKAGIRAPRAVAYLVGFKLEGEAGDAVILEAIEPSVPLDELLNDRELHAAAVPEHRALADEVISLVQKLGKAGFGHDDLHLGNFLLHKPSGKVYLVDAYEVRRGGLTTRDVLHLGASVARFATAADLVRGWRALTGGERGERPPGHNPVGDVLFRPFMQRVGGENRYFGRIPPSEGGGWGGAFFRHSKFPRRWSRVSRLHVSDDDWKRAWEKLLRQMESGELKALKESASGVVLAATVTLGGEDIEVVVKRPRRRYWYRYLNEIGRGSRARRAWHKAWALIARSLPTAWPVAFMEKRRLGYVTDAVIVSERVPGPTLWGTDLDAMPPADRETMFRRTGRILRRIERFGFSHFDAKASNWIIRQDPVRGPDPVLIDVDGVRRRRWDALGIQRLLRSMRQRRQYTPEDSLALCVGYAPYSRIQQEEPEQEQPETEGPEEGAESEPKLAEQQQPEPERKREREGREPEAAGSAADHVRRGEGGESPGPVP
jgi:tRNA A-37 threonylcarbamoyl transferase component Bud32